MYDHITGRGKGGESEGFRKTRVGFLREGILVSKKRSYEITVPRSIHSAKLTALRKLRASSFEELLYDLNIDRLDVRFDQLVRSYEINHTRGWDSNGRLDFDLRLIVLKHLLRGIFFNFIEGNDNLEEGKIDGYQQRSKWILDPSYLIKPARLRKIPEKDYLRILNEIWKHLDVKTTPRKTTYTGILMLLDLNALYETLRTHQGRRILIEAFDEANEEYKHSLKRFRAIHDPRVPAMHSKEF